MTSRFHTPLHVVITGAGSGIGLATAHAFAANGALGIYFADINEDAAKAAASEVSKVASAKEFRTVVQRIDIRDLHAVQGMFDAAVGAFGRIDAVVNSAGIGNPEMVRTDAVDPAVWTRIIDINLTGTFNVGRAAAAALLKQERQTINGRDVGKGCIINVASVLGITPIQTSAPYTAAKHGVQGLTKTMALEYAPDGIRVNSICPGWIETPMIMPSLEERPDIGALIQKLHPAGRLGKAEEVADSIVYLCSPAASFVYGSSMVVDGGLSLNTARAA